MEERRILVPEKQENAFVPGVAFGLAVAFLIGYVRKHHSRRRQIIDASYDLTETKK